MCEYCVEHGEGKKWYLEMKNYSAELLHQELSSEHKAALMFDTRAGFLQSLFGAFWLPAITGGLEKDDDPTEETPEPQDSPYLQMISQMTEEWIVEFWKFGSFRQLLPVEDIEKVIDLADSITRLPCGCRYISTGKSDQRYCFGLGIDQWGILGKFPDAASSLEVIEKEEAKKIIRSLDQEGLIHDIATGGTPYVCCICNCDRDCLNYKMYIEEDGVPTFYRAEYICQIDWDLCNGCKACISQCQFGAEFYSSALGKVYIDPRRCYGCGVCRAVCPTNAISLVPREQVPEVADLWLKTKPKDHKTNVWDDVAKRMR